MIDRLEAFWALASVQRIAVSKRSDGLIDVSIRNPVEPGHTTNVVGTLTEALEWLMTVPGSHPHHKLKNAIGEAPTPVSEPESFDLDDLV